MISTHYIQPTVKKNELNYQ